MDAWQLQAYDAIVIGSGPGGAAVALGLTQQGKRVLILEWGSADPIQGTITQGFKMGLIPGRSLFFTPDMLGFVRAITLGGSSVMAYATAFEPSYPVFDRYGIDLRPEVHQLMGELPVAPLKEELLGASARRIRESARDLGYPWESLPKIVHQELCRTNCDKCTWGCPYGAKWTARELVERACQAGATLLTGAKVVHLEAEANRVKHVIFARAGTGHTVSAPLVVLAAGGVGTPVLLNASGVRNAGKDFFFDPLIITVGSVEGLDDGKEFPMSVGFHEPDEGYVISDCVLPHFARMLFTLPVLRVDRLGGQRNSLQVMVKIKDDLAGEIKERPWVNKRLTQADRQRLKGGTQIARKILKHAGAEHIYSCMVIAAHPGGSARIGDTVDTNLKTRYENLYVCDCSVIPESWGRPPMITILALARRLVRHLASY